MLEVCALSGEVLKGGMLLFVFLWALGMDVSASCSSILHEESLSLRLMRLFACLVLLRSIVLAVPKMAIGSLFLYVARYDKI
jgi:hypothetical protein